MATISEFRVMTNKDIRTMLEVSDKTAIKIKNDIKETQKCPIVLYCHFKKYFNIP